MCAGRRVELISKFQEAAKKIKINSKIVAGDSSITAPALYFADDRVILPEIHDKKYIDEIIRICNEKHVCLVIPTIDTDLLILSENKEKIFLESGARVLVSNVGVISTCRDKIKTHLFLLENEFKIPRMYSEEELDNLDFDFPLFIKPKSGSSSVNTFKVESELELATYRTLIKDYIVQDFLEGDEYTIDAFLDFDSKVISIVPRLRMAIRSGEISKGKIIKDKEIIEEVDRLLRVLKPIGHITLQLMKTKKGIEFIEINPRFGGGAPMSIDSGANSCEYLYRLIRGEELEYSEDYNENIIYLRFDQSISLDENLVLIDD